MAREILFKAKIIDDGEWVEGYYTCFNGTQHRIYTGYAQTVWGNSLPDFYAVDENTICQYTGLTDYDGKKIFENDIIRLHDMTDEDYIVVWREDMGAYILCDINTKVELIDLVGDCVQEIYYVEVIGNIFDNPELLGGAE